jgi:hypothetical protein
MGHEANAVYRMKNLDKKILFGLAAALIVSAGSVVAQRTPPQKPARSRPRRRLSYRPRTSRSGPPRPTATGSCNA